MNKINTVFAGLLIVAITAAANVITVNPLTGSDANPDTAGKPLKTLLRAVRIAQPGDTILLDKIDQPYNETFWIYDKTATPEKPITIDGQGAIIDATQPLDENNWQQISPGLFKSTTLHLRWDHHKSPKTRNLPPSKDVVGRYIIFFDGKPQRMGRTSKGKFVPFLKVSELTPGQWTFVESEQAFYIKINPGQSLKDAKIELPCRSNGIAIAGTKNANIIIKNMILRRAYNDGVNVHGKCRNIYLENVIVEDCGDDGISVHDDCRVNVRNFTSRRNSTGIADCGVSVTSYENIVLENNYGVDLFFFQGGEHKIKNATIKSIADFPLKLISYKDFGVCSLELENVNFDRTADAPKNPGQVIDAKLVIKNCMFINMKYNAVNSQVDVQGLKTETEKQIRNITGKELKC